MSQLRVAVVSAVVVSVACNSGASPTTTKVETTSPASLADRAVINEHAFARLYGVLRWFHPSDEAAAVDWNRYASLGVERVRGAGSRDDLAAALTALVQPIAPSVVIAPTDHPPPPRAPLPAGADQTWWQHLGPGLTGDAPPYTAKRHGRPAMSAATPQGFGVLMRGLDAKPYRGKRVRLRARVAADHGHGQLWLRVDRPNQQMGFFDNMGARPVTSAAWTDASIEGPIADDAEGIVFGALQAGTGVTRYDDFQIDVAGADGAWTPVPVDNAGFDNGLTGWHGSIPKPTDAEPPTFLATAEADPASGKDGVPGKVAVLQPVAGPMRADEPFTERPNADEVTVVDLGDGLSAWVPLVVALQANRTQPPGDPAALAAALAAPSDPTADHVADVIVAWNVYAHFYPYLDVIGDDWNAVLDDALRDVATERAQAEHLDDDHAHVLERLVARAKDGHGGVIIPGRELAAPPIRFDFVEDKIVVTASDAAGVIRGDVVVTINGVPAAQRLAERAALASGSPQWQRNLGLIGFAAGPLGQSVALHLDRAGKPIDTTVECGQIVPPEPFSHPAVGEVAPGVWYVDMGRAEMAAIEAAMPELAAARGVVVDMRGYPNGNSDILRHIIRKPDTPKWMHIAHVLRPFQQSITGWDDMGWELAPVKPHLDHVVFITGPDAISYAESVMGYAQYEGLPIVGAASAGTNGNVRVMNLPTGAQISFTGMKVTRHDGGQHHLIGVAPTIPAAATIAGITAGKDEVLDAAIKALPQ